MQIFERIKITLSIFDILITSIIAWLDTETYYLTENKLKSLMTDYFNEYTFEFRPDESDTCSVVSSTDSRSEESVSSKLKKQ